ITLSGYTAQRVQIEINGAALMCKGIYLAADCRESVRYSTIVRPLLPAGAGVAAVSTFSLQCTTRCGSQTTPRSPHADIVTLLCTPTLLNASYASSSARALQSTNEVTRKRGAPERVGAGGSVSTSSQDDRRQSESDHRHREEMQTTYV
ncbi:hypothetical protein BaRGS_00014910, partial [Batillaria attramentaria]